ncbi:hypothetical protein M3J09_004138 [Ascochyta lentis]
MLRQGVALLQGGKGTGIPVFTESGCIIRILKDVASR